MEDIIQRSSVEICPSSKDRLEKQIHAHFAHGLAPLITDAQICLRHVAGKCRGIVVQSGHITKPFACKYLRVDIVQRPGILPFGAADVGSKGKSHNMHIVTVFECGRGHECPELQNWAQRGDDHLGAREGLANESSLYWDKPNSLLPRKQPTFLQTKR